MKKTKNKIRLNTSVITLLIMLSLNVNSQSLELGIRYDAEFTQLLNKNDHNAGPDLSDASNFQYLNFGIGGIFNFNKNIGIAVDLLFSREGQRYSGNYDGNTQNSTTYSAEVNAQLLQNDMVLSGDYVAKSELNFFKVPIMLSLTTDNTQPLFLSVMAGPQINFLYNVAQELNHEDIDYPNSSISINDLYKSVTIDGVAEAGIGCNLSPHFVLSAHLRCDYGFEDIENKNLMVSYNGAAPVRFYSENREATHNITYGFIIGLDFKL